jgi:hypothetical protein
VSQKEFDVTCPCCQSRLAVDVRTGKVLRSRRAEELDETGKPIVSEADWDAAHARTKDRLGSAAERFDAGLAGEKTRAADLDDLFKKAADKVQKRGEKEL